MKKLFYTIIAFAGILAASCSTDEDKLVFNPSSTAAPTLGTLAGTTLSSDGADLTFEFTQPKYNVDAGVLYALYASDSQDFGKQEKLAATIGGTTVTFKQSALNSVILNLGGEPDAEFTIYLRLDSWLATNKNTAVESSLARSGVLSATFVPYSQLILDKDVYDHVWVMGDYCGWSHDNSQFLYNYNKDGKTFTGVIDFGEKAANGIKFTGAASWDEATGNWGTANPDDASEAASVTLLNGSNDNIMCYGKRFYKFTLDKKALVLTKEWGADKIGIVGTINNWAAPDVEMTFNKDYLRFWVDLEVTGDQEIKFRADEDWVYNWGADAKSGGDNIKVGTGKYRVYLDLNKGTVELNEKMYGKTEPSAGGDEPEPEKPAVWSLIGTIGGTNWDTDTDMTNTDDEVWIARSVALTANDEFKLRFGHDWADAVGGTEANSKSTIDPTNPYDVFKPVLGTVFATGGMNIQVGVEGTYDVTYDNAAKTILVENHKALFSLIGDINGSGWGKDFVMTQDGDVWTSPVVTIGGEFKIRYDFSWADSNTYGVAEGTTVEIGKEFTVVQPGGNIKVPEAGDYKVIFNAKTLAVTIQK